MTSVTTTASDQVYLVNIMSVAEERLQSNFRIIMKKLQDHDRLFEEHQKTIISNRQQQINMRRQRDLQISETLGDLEDRLKEQLTTKVQELDERNISIQKSIEVIEMKLTKNQKDKLESSLQINQLRQYLSQQLAAVTNSLTKTQQNIQKAFQQIYKKQDSVEALKMNKEINLIKQKNNKYENDSKLIEHKIEKIQIMSERAERNQGKKQTELLREIQEKIKKEVRQLQKNPKNHEMSSREDIFPDDGQIGKSIHYRPPIKERVSLQPQYPEEESDAILQQSKPNLQRMVINKLNERFTQFEAKIKNIEEQVRQLEEAKKPKKKDSLDNKIKEKIDELKPQMVKLWAKCDTLDDRIVFVERKSEERNKLLNGVLETQRENNWIKMEEKLKVFQTEMYATLKEMKLKTQNKLNISDYEKYCLALEDRLKQISELIYLKSDKIEVKKALLFLESKIKEIILVISQDEQQEKDALLTKKQLKCISCDKQIEKMAKLASSSRGNWDGLPLKDHSPELLGRFGMTNFGSLSKKLKKLESKDLPILKKKNLPTDKENQ